MWIRNDMVFFDKGALETFESELLEAYRKGLKTKPGNGTHWAKDVFKGMARTESLSLGECKVNRKKRLTPQSV
ncbi:hypothetical protein PoB_005059600 [Plakobranchus ocellatus]|uniref:Uncharacterized protein n=1 Tax=Plakobranchus ocellatus TaxID=259542 RepID=A0AAV4BYA6_9GAST|nr:hypothetical protein PoB_005059600 [Plakobranchus ocellatus]